MLRRTKWTGSRLQTFLMAMALSLTLAMPASAEVLYEGKWIRDSALSCINKCPRRVIRRCQSAFEQIENTMMKCKLRIKAFEPVVRKAIEKNGCSLQKPVDICIQNIQADNENSECIHPANERLKKHRAMGCDGGSGEQKKIKTCKATCLK